MTDGRKALLRLLAVLAAAVLVFAACGGGDEEESTSTGGGDGGGTTLSAVDNSFDPSEITAPAGEEVTIAFSNDGDNPHTFSSEEAGFDSGTVDPGSSKDVTFKMPEEETDFQCNIHGSAMSGTLVPEG